jgi:hypothetical protein
MTKQTRIIAVLVGLVGAGIAYWLISPLFIDKEVIEDIPFVSKNSNIAEQIPDVEIRGDYGSAMMEVRDLGKEMTDTMVSSDEPQEVATGTFVEVAHEGVGDVKIVTLGENESILRLENLDVLNGPDLRVLLSPSTYIKGKGDLGDYVELGELKGNKGDQNYAIPSHIDLTKYNSVVIYCKPFGVVFNVASLDRSE